MNTTEAPPPPKSLKVEIYFLTRDYRVLLGLVMAILMAGVLLAMKESGKRGHLESGVWAEVNRQIANPLDLLAGVLARPGENRPEDKRANEVAALLISHASQTLALPPPEREAGLKKVRGMIAASSLSAAQKQLYTEFLTSLHSLSKEPSATLLTLAYRQQLPGANFLLARLYLEKEEPARALHFMRREARFSSSSLARETELALMVAQKDYETLEALSRNPRYEKEWGANAEIELAGHQGAWFRMIKAVMAYQWSNFDPQITSLVLIAGGIWFIIALQAIQVQEAPVPRLSLCVVAFLLGVLSTTPTLWLVIWSEHALGLAQGKGFWGDVLFYLAGVGPREELCKWLAVLPLAPALLKRGNRLEMLMVSGFVGLGFAVEENYTYYADHPTAAYGRFLTANFYHLAATALIGWSFFEAWTNRSRWWIFPGTFALVSVMHGFYDIFVSLWQVGAGMIFVTITVMFFAKLRRFRSQEVNYFWMPASIILGLATVAAATWVHASARIGFWLSTGLIWLDVTTLGMLIYVLIWQTRNLRYDANL